ncbi:venom serine protease 34 [Andrena cerasifolii]|uniref:venom serine protease 34 n=1 Tax=Andrena cerasifolii TaxID=2819439 RepID=UPI0040378E85
MAKATLLLLSWLAFILGSSLAIDDGCNFYQDLTPGTTFYVYNPEYPYSYRGQRSCRWTMKSDYHVSLNCTTFQLPWSIDCISERLSVQVSSATTHQYCGDGSFNVESEGPMMTVTLMSPAWSTGGRFLCEAVAVKRPQDNENCQCGWKNPTRIVGGITTGVNEYPMMVGFVDIQLRSVYCGGTIIATTYVLSAAHCFTNRNIQELGALVGEHDWTTGTDTNATVLHRVSQVQIHPNYVKTLNLNDIAVVKTVGVIKFDNLVGPACLPFQHSADSFGGSIVTALGWGTTDFAGPPSDTLQKVNLNVLTNLQCSKSYQNINNDQICTYTVGKDSCQMDSGGPILWENPTTKRIVLTGIISYGGICGDSAGVNTRVGAFVDWITSVTPDASYCIIE